MVEFKTGFVGIIGKPNVGKSTILNELLGQKLYITSPKPNTTRYSIKGILSEQNYQIIFTDTPGILSRHLDKLSSKFNKEASRIIADDNLDLLLWVVSAMDFNYEDKFICQKLKNLKVPILLLINKIDRVKIRQDLLPYIQTIQNHCGKIGVSLANSFQLSAFIKKDIGRLKSLLLPYLRNVDAVFAKDMLTDSSQSLLSSEIIREKILRHIAQEIPYQIIVEITKFMWNENKQQWHIEAVVWVQKESHKSIVIGKNGSKLKKIGIEARKDIISLLGVSAHLGLWVKHKKNWSASLLTAK